MSVQTAALPGRKERLAFGQMPVLAHLDTRFRGHDGEIRVEG